MEIYILLLDYGTKWDVDSAINYFQSHVLKILSSSHIQVQDNYQSFTYQYYMN